MNNVILWIQTKSLDRNRKNEDIHYNRLIHYYNKIDNNRKELNNIDDQYKTLNKININKNDKHDMNYNYYKIQNNITISLFIFIIITM